MTNKSNITGRDSFIIARALAMSIAVMPRLPELFQAPSDRDDMLKLLFAIAKNDARHELDMAAATVSYLPEEPSSFQIDITR
jgi:hypothetical protein